MERQGQLGLECLHSSPCPVTSCFAICLPFFAFWPRRGHPSPTSQSLPTTNPSLSSTRETDLPSPFLGLHACSSSCPCGSCWCGCNLSGVGFLGLWHGIAICAFRNSFVPILQERVRTFCPSTGQDPAGVGNAGPNPRHQTEGQEGETRDNPG